jgi:hypothetical protein
MIPVEEVWLFTNRPIVVDVGVDVEPIVVVVEAEHHSPLSSPATLSCITTAPYVRLFAYQLSQLNFIAMPFDGLLP